MCGSFYRIKNKVFSLYLLNPKNMKYFLRLQAMFLASFLFSNIFAQSLTSEQSERLAQNLVYEKWNAYLAPIAYADIDLSKAYSFQEANQTWFEVYEVHPEGFVIVSTQQGISPVIGYAFRGSFPAKLDIISNYGGYLYTYVEEAKAGLPPSEAIENQWDYYLTDDYRNINTTPVREKGVEPLVRDTWNQDYPYNILCPEDGQGPGGHVYAGCVATAMSQIMYYWRYPETGQGSHGYGSNYGYLFVDFGATQYQWNAMQNDIDPRNPWAIAELQYHAGVGVDMQYSPNGSGAWAQDARYAMEHYFKYPNAQYLNRDNYSTGEWKDMLMDELDNSRPVAYYGYSQSAGHAFVCDGYQDNMYHFNFGWSGTGNGWYTLNDINGFHNWQQCLRYLEPDPDEYPYYASGQMVLTEKSGSFTDGSGPVQNYQDNTNATWIIDPQTEDDSVSGINLIFDVFELGDNDVLTIYDGAGPSAPVFGSFTGTNNPGAIESTGNKLCVVFESDGSGTGPGFYAEYNSLIPDYCNGMQTFTESSGAFSDGSGSFHYNNTTLCFYKIIAQEGNDIILNFNYFDTEEVFDFVKVYDNQEVIGTFSGSDLPPAVVASSGTMLIAWKTNNFTTAGGWEATYSTAYTGIEYQKDIAELDVFPVPASGFLNLSFISDNTDVVVLEIQTIAGNRVYHEETQTNIGRVEKKIETAKLPGGLYVLIVRTAQGVMTQKVVINQ